MLAGRGFPRRLGADIGSFLLELAGGPTRRAAFSSSSTSLCHVLHSPCHLVTFTPARLPIRASLSDAATRMSRVYASSVWPASAQTNCRLPLPGGPCPRADTTPGGRLHVADLFAHPPAIAWKSQTRRAVRKGGRRFTVRTTSLEQSGVRATDGASPAVWLMSRCR